MKDVRYWNFDKRHRCPNCHTIVDTGKPDRWWIVRECCRCGVLFTRWPRLAWFLPVRVCKDIATGDCPHRQNK
jgi:hypothetical protein